MIPLLQTKTADTAHTGIFASVTRPFPQFLGGAWGRGYAIPSARPGSEDIPAVMNVEANVDNVETNVGTNVETNVNPLSL